MHVYINIPFTYKFKSTYIIYSVTKNKLGEVEEDDQRGSRSAAQTDEERDDEYCSVIALVSVSGRCSLEQQPAGNGMEIKTGFSSK